MAWNGYDEWEKKRRGSGQYWNDLDLQYAVQDMNFAYGMYDLKDRYANATTAEEKALINAEAEKLRQPYGYSSGAQGNQINILPQETLSPITGAGKYGTEVNKAYSGMTGYGSFEYPEYQSGQWGGDTDAYKNTMAGLLDYAPFSYDYTKDPLYAAYKKEYLREGQRAQQDALAQAALMTGGVPSSYAQTAAQQAGNYYAAQLADALPQLRNQAYNEWQGNYNIARDKFNAAAQDNQFQYGVFSDAEDRRRQDWTGNLGLAQYGYETGYGQAQDRFNAAMQLQALDQENARLDEQKAQEREANAVYAFSNDGGEPYKITSDMGLNWVRSLQPGQSATGGDGSLWTKNADGSLTITRDGKTWTIAAEQAATGKGGGGASAGGGGWANNGVDSLLDPETWHEIAQLALQDKATAASLLAQFGDYMNDAQRNTMMMRAGLEPGSIKNAKDAANYAGQYSNLLPPPESVEAQPEEGSKSASGTSAGMSAGEFDRELNRVQQYFDRSNRSGAASYARYLWGNLNEDQQKLLLALMEQNGMKMNG